QAAALTCWRPRVSLRCCCHWHRHWQQPKRDVSPIACQRVIAAGMRIAAIFVSSTMLVPACAAPTKSAKTELLAFDTSPFPYSGQPPGQDKPFYDVEKDGRRGHTSPRGGIYWEDATYRDRRVLLHIPSGF